MEFGQTTETNPAPEIKKYADYVREKELSTKKLLYLSIMIGLLAIAGVFYYLGINNKLINITVPNNNNNNNNVTCTSNFDASKCPKLDEVKCYCNNDLTIVPNNTIIVNGS